MDEHTKERLTQAQVSIEQFEDSNDYQRGCAAEATKLWQQAHNQPDTLPDIGVLINWLALEIENKQYTITCASEENQQLKESMAEARAELERLKRSWDSWALKMWLNIGEKESDYPCTTKAIARLEKDMARKDKLIEQMYEAIKFSLIADEVRQTRNVCASDINDACETSRLKRVAALEAAERGE